MLGDVATLALVKAGAWVNRTWVLPIVAVSPTARCHSRCVSCEWWRADGATDLPLAAYRDLTADLVQLGTRVVVITGGEPLLRDDLWEIAGMFREQGLALHLMTSGLALRTQAPEVARHCAQVVVSLDGATRDTYARIRGVDGLAAIHAGVARLRALAPAVRITARATLHRHNATSISELVKAARQIGFHGISFLAADLTSPAFGGSPRATRAGLALARHEIDAMRAAIERCIVEESGAFATGFIAESPARLRGLGDYYAAHLGLGPFPRVRCHAPQVSVAIDADGTVRPCFFQPAIGSIRDHRLSAIVTDALPRFRAGWDPSRDNTCRRCVCALTVGWGARPWA